MITQLCPVGHDTLDWILIAVFGAYTLTLAVAIVWGAIERGRERRAAQAWSDR